MTTHICPQCKTEGEPYQPICPACGSHQPEYESDSYSDLTLPWSGAPEHQAIGLLDGHNWANKRVGNFQVLEVIAQGGFGQIYRALDLKLDREVAIKFLRNETPSDRINISNLKHEAKAASALNHPNICTIYELGEVDDQVYIVMELLDGKTLKKSLPEGGFELDRFLELAIQIASGLEEAHRRNIIHRDIKPGNIQITERQQVKILDFGLAKRQPAENALESTQLSVDGQTMGTLHYMSPEQVLGEKVDYRSDIFSLGIVFYQMLTGHLPFKQESLYATMDDIVNASPPPLTVHNAETPKAIIQMIGKMLAKDPEKRYSNISEVLEELRAFETKIHTPPPRPTWPFLTLALLPLFLLAAGLLWRNISSRPTVTMALQPFQYQGPQQEENLPEALIGLFFQSLHNIPKVNTVPLMTSREIDAHQQPREVARQFGVQTVLGGQFSVRENHYLAQLRLYNKDNPDPFWEKEFKGETQSLYADFQTMYAEVLKALKVAKPEGQENRLGAHPQAVEAYQRGMRGFEDYRTELDTVAAYSAFHEALKNDPSFAPAHAGLAMTHWVDFVRNANVEDVEKASREANLAISKAPNQPEGFMAAGMVALGRGRTTEAMELFRQAQDLAPADESIAIKIGDAFTQLNRFEQAESMYQQAIGLRPGSWIPYLKLGRLYFHFNKPEQADEMFKKVITLNPNTDTGYNNLAAVFMRKGDFQKAAPLLALGIKYNASSEAYSNLGFVYFTLNRFDEAAEQFQKAIELSPNDPINYGNLGDALRHGKRQEEAEISYNRAIDNLLMRLKINPRDWDQKAILAMFLAGAGRCEESLAQLQDLTGRWTGERHYYAAISQAVCNNVQAAREHIKEALLADFMADIPTNLDLQPHLDESLRALIRAAEER